MPPETAPNSYAEAIRRKNEARGEQRDRVQNGSISPSEAQERASLFHGVPTRVLSYGQGAGI